MKLIFLQREVEEEYLYYVGALLKFIRKVHINFFQLLNAEKHICKLTREC